MHRDKPLIFWAPRYTAMLARHKTWICSAPPCIHAAGRM